MSNFVNNFSPNLVIGELENVGKKLNVLDNCRFLHVGTGNMFGGIEKILVTISKNQNESEHYFALTHEGKLSAHLKNTHSKVENIGPYRYRNPFSVMRARKNLRSVALKNKIDVVIFYSSWTYTALSSAARSINAKTVFWAMNYFTGGLLDWYFLVSPPDALLFCSSDVGKSYVSLVRSKESRVVCPPVDNCMKNSQVDRDEKRRSLGIGQKDFVILMASRIDPYKGHRLLIQSLNVFDKKFGKNWTAIIAGIPHRKSEEVYLAKLKKEIAEMAIGVKIKWLGHREDISDLMKMSDVFCHPNIGPEPFGVVFLEAQALGCPVVTTGFGGALDSVEDNGINILVQKPCPELFADALALVRDKLSNFNA